MSTKVNVPTRPARSTSQPAQPEKHLASVPAELLTESLNASQTEWLMNQPARKVQEHAVTAYIGREQGKYFERTGLRWSGFDCQPMEDAKTPAGRLSSGDAVALGLAKEIGEEVVFTVTRFGIDVDPDTQRRTITFE